MIPIWSGKRRLQIVILILCGVLLGITAVLFSLVVSKGFVSLTTESKGLWLTRVHWFALLVLTFSIITGILKLVEKYLSELIGQNFAIELRTLLYKHLLYINLKSAEKYSSGAKMLRFVTDLNSAQSWVKLGLSRLFVATAMFLTIIPVLLLIQPYIALIVTLSAGSAIAISLPYGKKIEVHARNVRKYRARLAATINDRISALPTIQVSEQQERELERVTRQSQELLKHQLKRAATLGQLRGLMEGASMLAVGVSVAAGMYLVRQGLVDAEEILSCAVLIGLVSRPLNDVARIWEYWKDWKISSQKFNQFLRLPRNDDLEFHEVLPAGLGALEVVNLITKSRSEPINVTVDAGKRILLSGRNGVGKTEFLMTIAGLRKPDCGQVLLDGASVHHYLSSGTGGISIVSPDLTLLRGTLRKNIQYSVPKIKNTDAKKILKDCGMEPWVMKLPNGIETLLIEQGKNLSAGERQLLLFARALITQPRLLLLDEMDTHLDHHSKIEIQRMLRSYQGTVIIVSHSKQYLPFRPDIIWELSKDRISVRPCSKET